MSCTNRFELLAQSGIHDIRDKSMPMYDINMIIL